MRFVPDFDLCIIGVATFFYLPDFLVLIGRAGEEVRAPNAYGPKAVSKGHMDVWGTMLMGKAQVRRKAF